MSVCHIFCRNPLILTDLYAIRTPIVWHIFGAYFLGVVRIIFNTLNTAGKIANPPAATGVFRALRARSVSGTPGVSSRVSPETGVSKGVPHGVSPDVSGALRAPPECPKTLIFFSLLFWKKQGKPPKKARIFSLLRTPKIPGKEGKNAQKARKFLATKKARKSKKARKGRSGKCPESVSGVSKRCPDTPGTLVGHWTLRSPGAEGPWRHSVTPRLSGTLPETLRPEGPERHL